MDVFVLANDKWRIMEGVFSSLDKLFEYLDKEVKKGNIQPYDQDKFYSTSEFEPFILYKTKVE